MNFSPVGSDILRTIKEPFSENDVLYLQDLFLTPGVHHIEVDNIIKTRTMIDKVLYSLQYHQKAACLSLSDLPLATGVSDVLKTLIADDYLVSKNNLVLFFLEHFYFDFLWIEETPNLLDSMWYEQFKQHLTDFNFNRSIPIVRVAIK